MKRFTFLDLLIQKYFTLFLSFVCVFLLMGLDLSPKSCLQL